MFITFIYKGKERFYRVDKEAFIKYGSGYIKKAEIESLNIVPYYSWVAYYNYIDN